METQSERLASYLERRQKQLKHFQKWEKDRAKSLETTRFKKESKLGQARQNQTEAQLELERISQALDEKFREHAQRLEEKRAKQERENLLKHEREALRFEDQQQNLVRQKR